MAGINALRFDRHDFEDVLGQYPDIAASMKKEAYKQVRCVSHRRCFVEVMARVVFAQVRRMGHGIAERLRAAADNSQHSSAFTRIPWDWEAAEAELAVESSGPRALDLGWA